MKGKFNEDIDKKIIECLNNKSEEISVSDDMFFKIRGEILRRNEGGFLNMKFRFLKVKTMIAVGILCIATTITCVAATNGLQWISSSSNSNVTNQFPTTDTVKNTVGYIPKYVEKFEGGFKFDGFNFSNDSLKNDNNNTVIECKSADFYYTRDGAKKDQSLFMSANSIDKEYFNKGVDNISDITEYNGVKIYYRSIQSKFVPVDYVQTEEDLKLIQEGLLEMGFGSDKISECKSQSVSWYENGIEYSILNMAYEDVNRDAMIKMAKTVINHKN